MKTLKPVIIVLAALVAFSAPAAFASTFDLAVAAADKKPEKKKVEIKEAHFHVHLHCESCVKKVRENISFEKGVKDLKVSLEDQTVDIKYDASKTSEAKLKAAIEALGYKVSEHGGESHNHSH